MTKKQIALRVTLPLLAIVILVALVWQPTVVWFRIYQLRGDAAPSRDVTDAVVELGPTVQASLIDAIYAYAPEPDVGHFRPAAFGVIVRFRREHVLDHRDHGIFVVQPDNEAINAMVAAYESEPSAAYRQEMRQALRYVDEWTHFVFWGRTATGPYPMEEIPHTHFITAPRLPGGCDDMPMDPLLPELAGQWCEHVGSVVHRWLAEGSEPFVISRVRIERLLDRRCAFDALITDLRERAPELSATELLEVLNHAFAHQGSQAEVLTALIHPGAECDWQRRLHRGLEIRRPHAAETPELLRAWVTDMDDACLAELFDDTEPNERRDRMRRSLGVSEARAAE